LRENDHFFQKEMTAGANETTAFGLETTALAKNVNVCQKI
jgi:hypothetical protein